MENACDIDVNHFPVSLQINLAFIQILRLSFDIIFTARMFDYFDNGVMEELQHRLMHTVSLINNQNGSITFKGRSIGRRVTAKGTVEHLIKWNPYEM